MRHRAPRQVVGLARVRAFLSGWGEALRLPPLHRRLLASVGGAALVLTAGGAWANTALFDEPRDVSPVSADGLHGDAPTADDSSPVTSAPDADGTSPGKSASAQATGAAATPTRGVRPSESASTRPPIRPDGSTSPSPVPEPTEAEVTESTDGTAPETTISSGPVDNEEAVFAFTASEPATFTCSLDGGAFQACGSSAEYGKLDAGWHTLAVRATDVAGNTDSTADTWRWHSNGR